MRQLSSKPSGRSRRIADFCSSPFPYDQLSLVDEIYTTQLVPEKTIAQGFALSPWKSVKGLKGCRCIVKDVLLLLR